MQVPYKAARGCCCLKDARVRVREREKRREERERRRGREREREAKMATLEAVLSHHPINSFPFSCNSTHYLNP